MWVQLALLAAQMILGEVTRPRPKRVSFDEFQKDNSPSEIRPIPYVAGTEEVTPTRIWYGDFSQRAVERDSHWTDYLFLGLGAALLDTITVAYRYYCGEAFALCFGPDAHVERVTIGERIMYAPAQGTENAGGGFLIDDPQAWGGDQPPGEGGQYSWCDITRGNYTDPANAYLESLLSTAPNRTPALRGVSLLVSRGRSGFTESGYFAAGGVGFTPRFKEWKVTVRRQPNNLATAYSKIGRHANPMEVAYEHATSLEFGAQLPVSEIHLSAFQSVAQTLHTEGLGWSGKIESPTTPLDVIKNIEAQVDASFDVSPSLGWTVRLIRRDYSFGSLPVMNRDNVTNVEQYSPGTYEDTVNKILVPFEDQDNNFAARPGVYVDPANQMIQGGRVVPQTQDYIGVADAVTANLLATRDGRALAVPRPPLSCSVLPSFGRLRYRGEVVKFEWSDPTFSKLMRIQAITPGNVDDPDYKLVCIEDQFATGARTFGEPSGSSHTDPAVGLDTAPPSASWNDGDFPPDGLDQTTILTVTNQFQSQITGGIIFGSYAPGGQYARIYVTEPGGVQTLSPIYLSPDDNLEATFTWPAVVEGEYEFCAQTYSLHHVTNGVKVCASIDIANIGSPSVSPSASVSPSVSPSSSASPSVSPSASVSPSISPSASASASASSSASASQSPSSSASPSVSPSSSASPSMTPGPDSVSDLELWLKADSLGALNDGDEIDTWSDSSGNGNDATGVVMTTLKPTWKATGGPNSMPAVRLVENGPGGGYFSLPNFISAFTEGHYFVVFKHDSDPATNNPAPVLSDWGSSTDEYFPFLSDGLIYQGFGSSARKNSIAYSGSLANWRVDEVRTASGAWSEWMDGTSIHSTGTNTVAFSTAPFIAHGSANGRWVYGLVAEIIFYSRVLNAGEITTIYDYLEDKYGLTLP